MIYIYMYMEYIYMEYMYIYTHTHEYLGSLNIWIMTNYDHGMPILNRQLSDLSIKFG